MTVGGVNWIDGHTPGKPFGANVRIRYRHKEAPAEVEPLKDNRMKIRFDSPQSAISPGQAAVVYNGDTVIGLFQGMFEKNSLTFNPGWDSNGGELDSFTDIRELQRQLKAQVVEFISEADEGTSGPASFILADPDGNPILVDQHV